MNFNHQFSKNTFQGLVNLETVCVPGIAYNLLFEHKLSVLLCIYFERLKMAKTNAIKHPEFFALCLLLFLWKINYLNFYICKNTHVSVSFYNLIKHAVHLSYIQSHRPVQSISCVQHISLLLKTIHTCRSHIPILWDMPLSQVTGTFLKRLCLVV